MLQLAEFIFIFQNPSCPGFKCHGMYYWHRLIYNLLMRNSLPEAPPEPFPPAITDACPSSSRCLHIHLYTFIGKNQQASGRRRRGRGVAPTSGACSEQAGCLQESNGRGGWKGPGGGHESRAGTKQTGPWLRLRRASRWQPLPKSNPPPPPPHTHICTHFLNILEADDRYINFNPNQLKNKMD